MSSLKNKLDGNFFCSPLSKLIIKFYFSALHGKIFQVYKVVKYYGFKECGRSWAYQCRPLQLKNQITKHIALKSCN
jgi:hypothetical protein